MGLDLETNEARRLWSDYRRRLAWRDRNLSAVERAERVSEAESHIAEAMVQSGTGTEAERLRAALAAFGDLPSPPPAWRAPVHFALRFAAMTAIALCGLLILMLMHMTVIEMFSPDSVGLYWRQGDGFTLSYETQPGSREVLGVWFIPAALAVIAVLAGIAGGLYRSITPSDSSASARA